MSPVSITCILRSCFCPASSTAPIATSTLRRASRPPKSRWSGHAPNQRSVSASGLGDTTPRIMGNKGGKSCRARRPVAPLRGHQKGNGGGRTPVVAATNPPATMKLVWHVLEPADQEAGTRDMNASGVAAMRYVVNEEPKTQAEGSWQRLAATMTTTARVPEGVRCSRMPVGRKGHHSRLKGCSRWMIWRCRRHALVAGP